MYPREGGYCGYRGYPAHISAWGLFICVSCSLSFQSLVRIFHVFLLPLCPIFVYRFVVFLSDLRGPNFAEIHARGRRGRLESDHRDLIPPWDHGLLQGEAGKATMPVWLDRYEGVFLHGRLPWRARTAVGRQRRTSEERQ